MAQFGHKLISDEISDEIIKITKRFATEDGAHTVTVSRIVSEMGVSNRVFYNRFRNIDEVLEIVYRDAVIKMHESMLNFDLDAEDDFFEYIMDIAVRVLTDTYDIKMQFSKYMFEHDSLTEYNRVWWMTEMKKLVIYALDRGLVKEVDPDALSYSIWCFCRGYNADAMGRKLSKEEAVKCFRAGFGYFLEGLRKR